MVNSRPRLFAATLLGSRSSAKAESLHLTRARLLPKLRRQFAEFLNRGFPQRLSILCPPTCVGLRYGHPVSIATRLFSGAWAQPSPPSRRKESPSPLRVGEAPDLPGASPYRLGPACQLPVGPTLLRHPFAQTPTEWYGNINPFPIAYAFRPRLRSRLTLGGLAFPRKP